MAAVLRAQQPAMPVIGFLNSGSPQAFAHLAGRSAWAWARLVMSRTRTWRSNIAGRTVNTIDCLNWPPIWSAVRWPSSPLEARLGTRRQGGDLDDPDRLHERRTTRSSPVSSPASTGRAAISPACICSLPSWRQSNSDCCTIVPAEPGVRRAPEPDYPTCPRSSRTSFRRRPRSREANRNPEATTEPRYRDSLCNLRAKASMRSWSVPILFSSAVANKSSRWRHAMRCPRSTVLREYRRSRRL